MTPIFADTGYYAALLLQSDQRHDRAVEITHKLKNPVITTAWILTEVANSLSAARFRTTVIALVDRLQEDESVRILPPDSATFAQGVELYRNRVDKDWSLTDCISFVVMTREGITEALTADRDFEQAGFKALLK